MRVPISVALGAMLFAALLASGCRPEEKAAAADRRIDVRTQSAAPSAFTPSFSLTGTIEARTTSALSFRIGGRVAERLVDVGDHVDRGEVLARLDPSQQQADVANGAATVAAAEAALAQARSAFDRQKALIDKGFTTQSDFDAAQKEVRTAESNLDGARALLDIARSNLGYTTLTADAAGVVVSRSVDVGEVAPAAGTIFTVALDGPRDAVFDIYEQAFLNELDTSTVRISLVSDPSVATGGRLREISPTVSSLTGTVRVKVDVGMPPAAMALGAVVSGTIRSKAREEIQLPWTALASADGRPAVWTVDEDGSVGLKAVGVFAYETDRIVVRSGLAAGERVVTDGGKFLAPGMRVRVKEEPAS